MRKGGERIVYDNRWDKIYVRGCMGQELCTKMGGARIIYEVGWDKNYVRWGKNYV